MLYESSELLPAGLRLQYNRMRVEGFKHTPEKELKNRADSDKLNSIRDHIRSDKVNKFVNPEKQGRHIRTANEYAPGRSFIFGDLDAAQALVDKYHGTGEPQLDKNGNWKNKEIVKAETDVGVNVDVKSGAETVTNRFVIHYSGTGTHIVPTTRERGDAG